MTQHFTGSKLLRGLAPLGVGIAAWALCPTDLAANARPLTGIFAAVIAGLILQPAAGGLVVLLGVIAATATGALPPKSALAGYGDPTVWLVLAACLMARAMTRTGFGRRLAFQFIRLMGRRTLGLGYALVAADVVLAAAIPSNGARAGGVLFPIVKSVAEAYESRPGATARRLGAFLVVMVYQCEVIACALFLTGQASNVLIAKLAKTTVNVELTYGSWFAGGVVPALTSLVIVPLLLYRLFPPEITQTPDAPRLAQAELERLGPTSWDERLLAGVFVFVIVLWLTSGIPNADVWLRSLGLEGLLNYAVVALLGVGVLLLTGVLTWEDVTGERFAWDVFLWYGGLVRLAEALGETGLTERFAQAVAGQAAGWAWPAAGLVLVAAYFYAHYAFASITAHATAMYVPFLVVLLAAGAPALLAAFVLAYASNLCAGLTHYGTTPAPIYFAAGYVGQRTWWRLGLVTSLANLAVWLTIGVFWLRLLRYW
ncbi:MAG: anion permease [Chloracidobacterium sp.]|nr:anion permease [Chloracidobacterium sp.]MDW8217474.1 DASS family sodium-coupled anion symporter [Acidobacteriota bacterium]